MTIPTASLVALSQPPATAAPSAASTSSTQPTGTDSPFQAALTAASSQAQQTTAGTTAATAKAATGASDAAVATAASDALEELAKEDAKKDDATDASLAAILALAAQVFAQPVNTTASAQATGQSSATATDAHGAEGIAATRTRADQLNLDHTSGLLSTVTTANQKTSATTGQSAQTATSTTPTTAATTITIPTPSPSAVTAQTATATALRGGTSSIPAQGPIITNPIPTAPIPVDASVTNPPVTEPAALVAATALPAALLGDRGAATGERFAALAAAGAQLAATGPRSATFANAFSQELAGVVSATTSLTPTAVALPPVQPTELAARIRSTDDATSTLTGASAPLPPLPAFERGAPSVPAAQVAESVVAHAHVLERDGSVEFHMRLDPPDLGRVQIRLITRGDEVHGQVLVASDAVRQLLESQLPELRQRLEAAGVNIQQFDVATDTGGGSQNAYREAPEFAAPIAAASAPALPRARINRLEAGSLDVTV